MKKIFPYLFSGFLILLIFLIYGHWFSPNRPLAYYPPVHNHFPELLTEVTVEDVDGNKRKIEMNESPLTVFIITPHMPSIPTMDYYSFFSDKAAILGNARIVFLWKLGNEEERDRQYIRKVAEDDPLGKFVLTERMLSLYQQKHDLEMATYPVIFAYNQDGSLVYKGGTNSNNKAEVLTALMSKIR